MLWVARQVLWSLTQGLRSKLEPWVARQALWSLTQGLRPKLEPHGLDSFLLPMGKPGMSCRREL